MNEQNMHLGGAIKLLHKGLFTRMQSLFTKKQLNCCMKEFLFACAHCLMLGMLAILGEMLNSTMHCISPARGIIEAQASITFTCIVPRR